MIDDTKVAGLLSDLQKLDEAGRDRILDLLSLEVMKDVLKASLRQSERRGDSTMPPNPPVTKDMSEVVHRQDERPTKQAGQTTVLKYHKRPRIEEDTRGQAIVEREVIEIETDEDDATNSLIIRRSSRLKECVRRMEMITDSEGIAIVDGDQRNFWCIPVSTNWDGATGFLEMFKPSSCAVSKTCGQ